MPIGRKAKDLTKVSFPNITVLERVDEIKPNGKIRTKWRCKCTCGQSFERRHDYIVSNPNCSCGCLHPTKGIKKNRQYGNKSKNWRGYQEIRSGHFSLIKNRAKKSNIDFNITIEYIWDLYEKQNRSCALTGRPISFKQSRRTTEEETTASLDRINSNLGYIEGNIQWVHKDVNLMKNHFNQDYFIKTCQEIVAFSTSANLF